MQFEVFACLILIIPASLSKPQGCPCDAQSPLRCKEGCSQTDSKDIDVGQQALRQGQDNYYTNVDSRFNSYFKNPYESHRQNDILDLLRENLNQIGGVVPGMVPNMVPNVVPNMVPNVVPNMVPNVVTNTVPRMMPGRGGWGSLGGSWG